MNGLKELIEIVTEAMSKPRILWTPAEEFAEFLLIAIICGVLLAVVFIISVILEIKKKK